MAVIAKGMITLVNVNDAYSVTVTPSACAIKADFDGSNPILDEAYCDISVVRGDVKVPFTIASTQKSNNGITFQLSANGAGTVRRMALTAIPSDVLSGNVTMNIETEDEFVAQVVFQYSVIREATMLDWIQDWETNKTTIGNTYMITPKIFVGKRENTTENDPLGDLTGVYIGPSDIMGGNGGPGIYGYKAGDTIFHINKDTAQIAHWFFDTDSLYIGTKWYLTDTFTAADSMTLGLSGLIGHKWRLMADGSGKLAGGNISWTDAGELTILINNESLATTLNTHGTTISNHTTRIGSLEVSAAGFTTHFESVESSLSAHADSISGLTTTTQNHATRIGSLEVSAAGFTTHFESVESSLSNHASSIQQNANSISGIVTGLTNTGINISDGTLTLNAGSTVWQLNSSGDSYIAGWLIKSTRLATDNVCLESGNGVMGLYMSAYANSSFKTRTSNLEDFIDDRGGIYMQVKAASGNNPASANLAAYNVDGYRVFKLKTDGVSYIAGWAFDDSTLYTGTAVDISGSYTGSSGHITIGPNGLRGYKWRFEDTGAGALAGGNISWDAAGNVTFGASVSLNWIQGINEAKGLANSAQKSADISQQMAYGKMLFRDPEFSGTDYNGSDQYPFNMATGASSRALVTDNDAPNSTHKVMEITNTSWANEYDLRLGGFYFANQSRANAKFAVRIIAKIPLYWKIQNYHNQYGEDAITEWLTPTTGTGKYEEYICVVKCGANGTFSTINHFALVFDGPTGYSIDTTNNSASNLTIYVQDSQGHTNTISSVVWDIAYASVVDLTSSDKLTTAIDINGIYTGTLRADQIIAASADVNTLTAGFVISNGNAWALNRDGSGWLANKKIEWQSNGDLKVDAEIEAKNVTAPFVRVDIPSTVGYSGFTLEHAYNSWFAPSDGCYIFLPNDAKYSGRVITIHYGIRPSGQGSQSSPINFLCDNINARFFLLYESSTMDYHDGYRAIQLTAGMTMRLQAIPSWINDDNGNTVEFVNWYLLGFTAGTHVGLTMYKDDVIDDTLWTQYKSQKDGNL